MVCPTIWGMTVESRDHVLRTVFWPLRLRASILCSSLLSTYGPFFVDRDMSFPPLDNHLGCVFAAARPIPQRGLAPRGLGTGHAHRGATLTAAVRMISRRHGGASYRWPPAHMSPAPRLA